MIGIAIKILVDNKPRLVITVVGIAVLFFLTATLFGLLVGWCCTTSGIVRHTDADFVRNSGEFRGHTLNY